MPYNKDTRVTLGHLEALARRVQQYVDNSQPEEGSSQELPLATDADVEEMLSEVFGAAGDSAAATQNE